MTYIFQINTQTLLGKTIMATVQKQSWWLPGQIPGEDQKCSVVRGGTEDCIQHFLGTSIEKFEVRHAKSKDHREQVSSLERAMPSKRRPEMMGWELPTACAELEGSGEIIPLTHCHSPSSVTPVCLFPLFRASWVGPHLICFCASHLFCINTPLFLLHLTVP